VNDELNAFLHAAPAEGDFTVAVKDVIDVAGMPTTAASKILRRVPERDATCVARLRAAGAAIVGKLNTHEFAYGALTNSPHFGPSLNPWNPAHTTGGSSGGSGAAVAADLVDVALGTDTAGSIRIPAAFCGVTGHRPTIGLVPTDGVFPTAWSLDTVGPLASSRASSSVPSRRSPPCARRRPASSWARSSRCGSRCTTRSRRSRSS
jgi:aspartyl-tRNA(Asn)/glutamyl-tRNA(Gln) amidotransferase subunit A